jgi:hypothetical protein
MTDLCCCIDLTVWVVGVGTSRPTSVLYPTQWDESTQLVSHQPNFVVVLRYLNLFIIRLHWLVDVVASDDSKIIVCIFFFFVGCSSIMATGSTG